MGIFPHHQPWNSQRVNAETAFFIYPDFQPPFRGEAQGRPFISCENIHSPFHRLPLLREPTRIRTRLLRFCTHFLPSLPEFKKCHGYLRMNNYSSPCCIDEEEEEEVEGLGMHTDMSCITVVYQDDTGGLQVRSREGRWMDIAPRQDTLVVNIGDLMQAWSNGELLSSQHRVVLRRNVNRFSVAFFWCFEDQKLIYAPHQIVGGKSRLYKPFVCADYVKFRENNERGKFEKVGFTVTHFAGIEL